MGKVNFGFPDEVIFANDRNTITLQYIGAGDDTVGAALTFTNQQGKTANLMYNSEQPYLLFNLFSTIKNLMGNENYTVVTVSGSVICGELSGNITPFVLKCVDGRTLHTRSHNTERIIYYYDRSDLEGFQFLMLDGGTINFSNTQSGINKINLSNNLGDFVVNIVDGGTARSVMAKRVEIGGESGYNTDCGEGESVGGLLKVRYCNTDGCIRYLRGKITNRKRGVGLSEWRADDLIRHTPNAMITSTTDEITVGFPSVERESYAEDILFSPIIEYLNLNNEWQPCVISSKTLNLKEWDTNDIEITLQTLV